MIAPLKITVDALAVVGAGYVAHKVYTVVDLVIAKAQAVKTALTTTATAAIKPAVK